MEELTVDVQMLESVENGFHETVGKYYKLVVPEFEPLKRVKIFKCLVRNCVNTKQVHSIIRAIYAVLTGCFVATSFLCVRHNLGMRRTQD